MTASSRVLFVTGEYPPLRGGVSDYTFKLREELARIGQPSIVLTAEGAMGEGVHTIGSWSWPVALHIREIISQHPVDIVHIQYQAGAFDMHPAINALPTALTSWQRVPVVTTFHDLRVPYLFPKAGRLRQAVMLRMARASSVVIVTNPGDERVLGRAEVETVRIPLGPSLPSPDSSAVQDNGRSVGYFGFPSREKGLEELIEALAMFEAAQRPHLTIVGATRPDTGTHEYLSDEEVDRLADRLGVEIERTGYLPPELAADRLAGCSVIALPFLHGASQRSSALIAALGLGRPVVTTSLDVRDDLDRLSDLPQLVLVRPGDPRALFDGLQRGLNGNLSASPLPDEYQWRSIAEAHAALYDSLTARGR